jgi:hypothetical protein
MDKMIERERNLEEFLGYIKTQRRYYFRYLYSLGKDARRLSDKRRARRYFRMALGVEPWHPGLFLKYLRAVVAPGNS